MKENLVKSGCAKVLAYPVRIDLIRGHFLWAGLNRINSRAIGPLVVVSRAWVFESPSCRTRLTTTT